MKTMFVDLGKKADIEPSFFFFFLRSRVFSEVSSVLDSSCRFFRVMVDDLF